MLGGSAFSQLGIIVNNPSTIPKIIGTALPASSNFFINYVIIQVSLRLPLPHTPQTSFPHAACPIEGCVAFPMFAHTTALHCDT